MASTGDINGDGVSDFLIGADRVDDGGVDAGAAYLYYGPVSSGGSLASADVVLLGEDADILLGYPVASAGDVNSDGYDDFLLGARQDDEGGSGAGAVFLVFGPATSGSTLSDDAVKFVGENENDRAGTSTAAAGDVDGDGYSDILVGGYLSDSSGDNAGAAYLVLGPCSVDTDLGSADAKLVGESRNDWAGYSVAGPGDTNGDGYDDVLVGAGTNDEGGTDAGSAYLLLGPISGEISLSAADAQLIGESPGDAAGVSVAGAGDVDADGHFDILVGAPSADSRNGAAYLVYGPTTGATSLSAVEAEFVGEAYGDSTGWSLGSAGDIDEDGYGDILISAPYNDSGGEASGALFLVQYADLP